MARAVVTLFLVKLRRIGYQSYEEYLASDHWRAVRTAYRKSDRPQGCLVCGESGFSLHHITYDRLGAESLDDLIPLCQTHHRQLHAYHDHHHLSLEDYQGPIAVLRQRWDRRAKKRATKAAKKQKFRPTSAYIAAQNEAKAARKQKRQSARYAEDRLSDAQDRLARAEAQVITTGSAIMVLLARAGISDPVKDARAVVRLHKAFKPRGMRAETAKFQAYLDARYEVMDATRGVAILTVKVAAVVVRPPWVIEWPRPWPEMAGVCASVAKVLFRDPVMTYDQSENLLNFSFDFIILGVILLVESDATKQEHGNRTMTTKTFHYNGSQAAGVVVVNSAGTVIETTTENYPVGMKKAVKQLRACGWRAPKKVVQYDAFGRRMYNPS